DAAARFASDIGKLNSILREKYGVDLNGRRGNKPSLETDLLRVKFEQCSSGGGSGGGGGGGSDGANKTLHSFESSAFLDALMQSAGAQVSSAASSSSSKRESRDPFYGGNMRDAAAAAEEDVGEPPTGESVRLLCVGMPLTGCGFIAAFAG